MAQPPVVGMMLIHPGAEANFSDTIQRVDLILGDINHGFQVELRLYLEHNGIFNGNQSHQ